VSENAKWWCDMERNRAQQRMDRRRLRTTPGQLCECGSIHIQKTGGNSHSDRALTVLVRVIKYTPGKGVLVRCVEDGRIETVARQELMPIDFKIGRKRSKRLEVRTANRAP